MGTTEPVAAPPGADDRLADEHVGGRVVRGGAVRAVALIATNLLLAAGAIVLLRYLGVADFGRYGTVMALAAIVQGITDAGLTITGTREMALVHGEERRTLLGHVLSLRILLTGVGVVAAVAFAALAGYRSDMVVGTALAGAGVFLISVQSAMVLPLIVELRNGLVALNEFLRQALLVVGWVTLAVAGAGLVPFFAVQIGVGLVLLAITPWLVGRHRLSWPRWNGPQIRDLVVVALPIAAAGVIAVIYFRVLTVMASLLTGDVQTGLFVTAARVFEIAYGLPALALMVVLPVMTIAARDDHARLAYITQRMTEAMTLAGVLVALVVSAAATPIVLLLGGEQYRDAAPVLQIMSIAMVSLFIAASWSPALVAMSQQKYLALCSAIGLVVAVALGLALIPGLDARGAAIAFAIADWVLLGAMAVAIRRAGEGIRLDFRYLLRVVPVAALGAAVAFVPWGPDLVRAVAAAVVFAGGALAVGAVPGEVLDALRSRGPGARRGDGARG